MLKVDAISKSYNKNAKVLHNVSFELPEGTLTAVVGPSGCGKTTLLKILAGFLSADGGRIFFNENDVTELPTQKRKTAIMFQNYALWPHMNIYDNIAYGLRLQKIPSGDIVEKVNQILDLVELNSELVKHKYPSELSGGQQQRVALARALVVNPQILLLDEPLSNLDAKVRQKLRLEIRNIQRKLGLTALYVTHDQEEALSISDTVILMNQGRIIQKGTPQEIYNQPVSDFVAEFLGNSNVLLGEVKENQICIDNHPFLASTFPNGKAKVIFRASDIIFNPLTPVHPGVSFTGKVVERMFIGGIHRYLIQFGNQDIFADTMADLSPNQEVTLTVPRNKIYVFPM